MRSREWVEWEGDSFFQNVNTMHKLIDLVLDKIFEHGALPVDWEEYLKREDTIALIAEKADILLYPTKDLMNEINEVAKNIATTVALMSFSPGGVTFWGALYRSSFDAEIHV